MSAPGLPRTLAALRAFAGPRQAPARCELCGSALTEAHEHLLEPAQGLLQCTCGRCALLFSSGPGQPRRRVPRRAERLAGLELDDATWEALRLPIALAYFVRSSSEGRVVAYYPGPAGATGSQLPLEAWGALEQAHPALRELAPDVEALLVSRAGAARGAYRVSIDACFELVGLLRRHWRGFGGGPEAWARVAEFFAGLEGRSHA